MTNSQVAHAWANQTKESGKNANGSLYFDHTGAIYSYGRHFMIAIHTKDYTGNPCILFTTKGYSNTTAKQKSIVGRAIPANIPVYYVENFPIDSWYNVELDRLFTVNLEHYKNTLTEYFNKIETARTRKTSYIIAIDTILEELQNLSDAFKIDIPETLQAFFEQRKEEKYNNILANDAEDRRKNELRKAEIYAKQDAEALAKWRNYETTYLYTNRSGFTYLRKSSAGVFTSQGIEISAFEAKQLFRWIEQKIDAGGCEGGNCGMMVDGKYTVLAVNAEYVQIGCHKITIEECKNVYSQL